MIIYIRIINISLSISIHVLKFYSGMFWSPRKGEEQCRKFYTFINSLLNHMYIIILCIYYINSLNIPTLYIHVYIFLHSHLTNFILPSFIYRNRIMTSVYRKRSSTFPSLKNHAGASSSPRYPSAKRLCAPSSPYSEISDPLEEDLMIVDDKDDEDYGPCSRKKRRNTIDNTYPRVKRIKVLYIYMNKIYKELDIIFFFFRMVKGQF